MAKNTAKYLTKVHDRGHKVLIAGKSSPKALPISSVGRRKVTFSFLFFRQIQNFGISGKDDKWFSGLLNQLKEISDKEFDDLVGVSAQKKYFRLHPLEFGAGVSALKESDFDFIPAEYRPKSEDCKYWQFQISKANGRVIGFFNEDHTIFYLVFLDPNHNAQLSKYSDYKVRLIEPQVSEIDDLRRRLCRLADTLPEDVSDVLYQDDVCLCFQRELFAPFDKLMEEGSLQTRFEEFLFGRL